MRQKATIPDDWEGLFCCYAVRWPKSAQWEAVLRGVLTIARDGRFWNEDTGNIRAAQAVINQTLEWNMNLWEVIMSCGDNTVADAIYALAAALATNKTPPGGACCPSPGGNDVNINIQNTVTLSDGTRWPIYSDQPIPTLPESGVPEGYNDLEEYSADKCAKANKIISDLIVTLQNFSVLNLATGAIGATVILACLVGLITVPYVEIPLLLFALLASVTMTTVAGMMANYINDNREDFVCVLYQENNLETMTQLLADLLDIAVAAIEVTGAVAIAIKSIVLWLLNGNTLGILLTSDAKLLYPEADCSGCGAVDEVLQVYNGNGEWVDAGWMWGDEVTYYPVVQPNGFYYLVVRIGFEGQITPSNYHLAISAINASNSGNCASQGSTIGTYEPQLEEGWAIWNFGCTNQFQTSLTGVFTKDT